jgi:hypothetical protein
MSRRNFEAGFQTSVAWVARDSLDGDANATQPESMSKNGESRVKVAENDHCLNRG